jgi:hypothetical protein
MSVGVGNGRKGRLGVLELMVRVVGSEEEEDRRRTDGDWESAGLESVKGVKDSESDE